MVSCVRWRDRLVEVVTRANFLLLRWGKEKLSPEKCRALAWEETSTEQGLLMQERLNLAAREDNHKDCTSDICSTQRRQ